MDFNLPPDWRLIVEESYTLFNIAHMMELRGTTEAYFSVQQDWYISFAKLLKGKGLSLEIIWGIIEVINNAGGHGLEAEETKKAVIEAFKPKEGERIAH